MSTLKGTHDELLETRSWFSIETNPPRDNEKVYLKCKFQDVEFVITGQLINGKVQHEPKYITVDVGEVVCVDSHIQITHWTPINEDGWCLDDKLRARFKPMIQKYLDKMESLTTHDIEMMTNEELGLFLSGQGISPYQLRELFEEFGYEETDRSDNGWELDFWIDMTRKDNKTFPSQCEHLVIFGRGMTYDLKVYIEGFDF